MAEKKAEGGKRRGLGFLIIIVILGALIGSVIGEIVGRLVGEGTPLHEIFTKGIDVGFDPWPVDLQVLKFTFGLRLKLNLCSVLGIVFGTYLYRRL